MEKYCIGIDIGGTSVKFGLFDLKGMLLEKWSIPTRTEEKGKYILSEAAASVNEKLKKLKIPKEEITGIGVGVAGQVSADGCVPYAENLGWVQVPLARELKSLTGLPVFAENDANVAALGETWKGSAASYHSMIFVTLGTGVGGGVIVNNRILSGASGAAGEIGHIHVEDSMTEPCNCGNYGCLEQLASATGLRRLGKKAVEEWDAPSLLREKDISPRSIFEAAGKKDALAMKVLDQFGEYLGKALAACTCILNPEVVVIGGGVSRAGDILLEYIRRHYRKYAYLPCRDTKICLAALGSDAGIYGAAKLALEESRN